MKQHPKTEAPYFLPVRAITVLVVILLVIAMVTSAYKKSDFKSNDVKYEHINKYIKTDSIESVDAFMKVYKVLMSPRCMNCHPTGDIPLQGDDSHLHTMSPKRGKDGKGLYAMKCANCHQPTNTPGLHTPPGNPEWHLPPADMKMVFQGRSAQQLAKQIVDPKQNGHKTMEQLIEHANDTLVKAAWNPGEGRTLPPMSHEEFSIAWVTWLKKGAIAPAR